MAREPITAEEYERERAILDNMGAPPAAYEELDARPLLVADDDLEAALEDDTLEDDTPSEVASPEAARFLPPTIDRTADVEAAYARTLAALRGEDGADADQALAESIAYIVATLHVADLPQTMGQFRAVLDQLQAVFGSLGSGKGGGMLGKLLGGGKR